MPKNDGQKRKIKILRAAEELFSKEGFRGASIAEIAKAAGVNKALVYYYFKSKNDIVVSLFQNIVEELEAYVGQLDDCDDGQGEAIMFQKKIERELAFLAGRKRIISVMLMEALKGSNADNFLFRCAETVIQHHIQSPSGVRETNQEAERQKLWVSEFFTGFLPLIGFAVFSDKWCKYFRCDSNKASRYFLEAFARNHLDSQSL
jgi:TetR/AcrR family transcriptional regulator